MSFATTGGLMEYAEKEALNAVTLNVISPTAATSYLALVTATPAQADLTMAAETEFSTSDGYARQPLAAAGVGWSGPTSAAPSVISNALTLTFGPITTGAPGTCTWAILTDTASSTAGHCIAGFLLANARTPLIGDSLTAAGGSFSITL